MAHSSFMLDWLSQQAVPISLDEKRVKTIDIQSTCQYARFVDTANTFLSFHRLIFRILSSKKLWQSIINQVMNPSAGAQQSTIRSSQNLYESTREKYF
jgi:hypothetical protein